MANKFHYANSTAACPPTPSTVLSFLDTRPVSFLSLLPDFYSFLQLSCLLLDSLPSFFPPQAHSMCARRCTKCPEEKRIGRIGPEVQSIFRSPLPSLHFPAISIPPLVLTRFQAPLFPCFYSFSMLS